MKNRNIAAIQEKENVVQGETSPTKGVGSRPQKKKKKEARAKKPISNTTRSSRTRNNPGRTKKKRIANRIGFSGKIMLGATVRIEKNPIKKKGPATQNGKTAAKPYSSENKGKPTKIPATAQRWGSTPKGRDNFLRKGTGIPNHILEKGKNVLPRKAKARLKHGSTGRGSKSRGHIKIYSEGKRKTRSRVSLPPQFTCPA